MTFRAFGDPFSVEVKPMSEFTHIARLPCRITDKKGIIWNILRNNSPCPDKSILTDIMTANNGGIGADGRTFFYPCSGILVLPDDSTPRIDDVGKHHRGT